jgi:hypothetical protein
MTKAPGNETPAENADDPKAKFKAALERKRGAEAERAAAAEAHGDSKIHGTHGAAGGRRTFRRKSG